MYISYLKQSKEEMKQVYMIRLTMKIMIQIPDSFYVQQSHVGAEIQESLQTDTVARAEFTQHKKRIFE